MRLAMETGVYNLLKGGTALVALLADGTAGIYHGRPQEANGIPTAPYLVWSVIDDSASNMTPTDERNVILDIRGIATTSEGAALIGDAIEARMKTEATISGWNTIYQRLEASVEMIEDRGGKPIYHDGGRYVLEIHEVTT